MTELELNDLCKKKRDTKAAIEELKKQKSQRKLNAMRAIENRKIDKELGL